MRGNEEIIVHPFLGRDREGVDDWGPEYLVEGCIPWPRTSEELDAGGTVIGENVWIPPAAGDAVKDKDNVTLRGVRYAVDGKPADVRKQGRRYGLIAILKGIQ